MDRGLLQREIAEIIQVTTNTIEGWEGGRSNPQLMYLPKIIEFLGYLPDCCSGIPQLSNPLFVYRVKEGITQRELAKRLGVDVTTVQAIERGKRDISRCLLIKLTQLFS